MWDNRKTDKSECWKAISGAIGTNSELQVNAEFSRSNANFIEKEDPTDSSWLRPCLENQQELNTTSMDICLPVGTCDARIRIILGDDLWGTGERLEENCGT